MALGLRFDEPPPPPAPGRVPPKTACCYRCGLEGRTVRLKTVGWRPRVGPAGYLVRFRCQNNACMFDYTNYDGKPARGRPSWSAIM